MAKFNIHHFLNNQSQYENYTRAIIARHVIGVDNDDTFEANTPVEIKYSCKAHNSLYGQLMPVYAVYRGDQVFWMFAHCLKDFQ